MRKTKKKFFSIEYIKVSLLLVKHDIIKTVIIRYCSLQNCVTQKLFCYNSEFAEVQEFPSESNSKILSLPVEHYIIKTDIIRCYSLQNYVTQKGHNNKY